MFCVMQMKVLYVFPCFHYVFGHFLPARELVVPSFNKTQKDGVGWGDGSEASAPSQPSGVPSPDSVPC